MRVEIMQPEFLFLLVVVPLMAFAHFLFLKYTFRRGMKFSNFQALRRITGESILTKNLTQLFLRLLLVVCVVFAASGLVLIYEGEVNESDFVIAIDSSASMTATDFSPSRLDAAKNIGKTFVDNLGGKSKVGVMSFSGYAIIQTTLTDDPIAIRSAINNIHVESSGTDLANAIITSSNILLGGNSGRQVVLITDGEMTTSLFEDRSIERAIDYARLHGVVVHTIGVGTENATPLGYLPRIQNLLAQYNENNLQQISEQTGGNYYHAFSMGDLEVAFGSILNHVSVGEKRTELAGWLLVVAILLVFIEWILSNTYFRILP